MSLDISSDIDFLREMEGLELDDVSMVPGSPVKKQPVSQFFPPNNTTSFDDASIISDCNPPPNSKKIATKKSATLPKLEPIEFSIESIEPKTIEETNIDTVPVQDNSEQIKEELNIETFTFEKTKSEKNNKPTKKKRPPNQKKSNSRKPLDFNLFDFGSLQTPSNEIQTNDFIIQSSPIDLLEKRLSSYLEQSINSLKSEILQEINYCMQKDDMISTIVYNFLMTISTEVTNEIKNLQPFQILDSIDLTNELDLTIPKLSPKVSSFPVSNYLNSIYMLKSRCLHDINNITNDLSTEIQTPNSNASKVSKYEDSVTQKLRYLQNKSDSLQIIYDNLEETQRSLYKRKLDLEKKKEEVETQKTLLEEKFNDIYEIKSSIEDLRLCINSQTKQTQHSTMNRINELISHNETVLDLTKTATMSIHKITNNYQYSNEFRFSNQNLNINVPPRQSYSAPYSPVTPPSPISTPRRVPISHFSDSPYTPHSNDEPFSPVFVRQTPHYTVYSDDDDDISLMNNCLLNKRLSHNLTSYV